MAESKSKRNLEEDVIRYIYNSRFYPDRVVNEDGPAFLFDNSLMGLIDNAKSYDEARNILISALDDESNLQLARNAARDYLESFGEEGNTYDWEKSFGSRLDRVPLNVDALPYDVVEKRSNDYAKALGFSDINGMIQKMNENTVLGNFGQPGLSDGFLIALRNEMKNKLKDGTIKKEDIADLLDYSPNADEDYIVDKAFEYADRVKRKNDYEKMGDLSKGAQEFLMPYQARQAREGKKPTPMDLLVDVATFAPTIAGSVKYSKGKNGVNGLEKLATSIAGKEAGQKILNYANLAGLGVIGGAMEPIFTRANDAADALLRKRVYANEGSNDEVSEKDDLIDALKIGTFIPDVGAGIQNNIGSSFMGLTGRAMSKVIGNLTSKIAQSKAGNAVKNGLNALFGGKKNAANSTRRLHNEKKAIESEIDDFFNNPKSNVTDDALRMNQSRLGQIAREEEEIRKRFAESASNKAQTALDALLGGYVIKSGLSPDRNAKNAIKNAYLVDYLNGL